MSNIKNKKKIKKQDLTVTIICIFKKIILWLKSPT